MAEYIKRDDVISGIKKLEESLYSYAEFSVSDNIESIVEDIPAADVREDVGGKWIFEKGDGMTCVDGWCCSNCNHGFHTNVPYFSEYNFCPNCGADMRGENNG